MTRGHGQNTCQWYVSIEEPECGEPAPFKVKVKGRVTQATVFLCERHKKVHDENFARLRSERDRSTPKQSAK